MYIHNRLFISTLILCCVIYSVNIRRGNISISANTLPAEEDEKKVILIDPGHGGMDGGAVSKRGTLEKDINLSISFKLRDKLVEYGYVVKMTREGDTGLYTTIDSVEKMKHEDLNNRCSLKETSDCDIFISIHQNYFPQSKYYGAQVWYAKSNKSKRLAQIIQKGLIDDLNNNNKREEKSAGNDYKILRCNKNIPSVIVECGFLSNFREEVQLKNETYQQIVAESIAESVKEFFEQDSSITLVSKLRKFNIFRMRFLR